MNCNKLSVYDADIGAATMTALFRRWTLLHHD
jgi:hypothetical protein